jgi:uncharacterized membrane protein YdbT with pleckstrin-like domain
MKNQLVSGEKVLYVGKRSICNGILTKVGILALSIFSGSLLFIGIVLLLCAAVTFLDVISTVVFITNKRVFAQFGLFSRNTVELNIDKVEGVQVSQSVVGQCFNFGTLHISGTGTTQVPIPGISAPFVFKKTLNEIMLNL